jgi:hypothetical protein
VGIAGIALKTWVTYTTLGRIFADCQIAQMVSFHQFRGTIDHDTSTLLDLLVGIFHITNTRDVFTERYAPNIRDK